MELRKDTTLASVNSPHLQALSKFVEFSWKATRGLVEETETHVQQLVDRLVNVGKITAEEQITLSALLNRRMSDSRKRFLQTIDSHIQTAVEKIAVLSREEAEKLEKEVTRLEQKISQITASA